MSRLRLAIRTLATAAVATIPAWAFFGYLVSYQPDAGLTRVLAITAALLTAAAALIPTIQSVLCRMGRSSTGGSSSAVALSGLAGVGAIVSVMQNGGRDVEGLETTFALALFVTLLAAIVGLTTVTSAPSPAGVRGREFAEAVVRRSEEQVPEPVQDTGEPGLQAARAEIGRQEIAAGFRQYGDANESSSRAFLVAGVVLFAGSVAAALSLVARLGDEASVASILTRAAISLPGAVVFAVFVREAAARRRYAAWGGLIAIQAEHLGAFTADMPPEARNELEMQFARSVFRGGDVALDQSNRAGGLFGRGDSGRGDAAKEAPSPTLDAASQVLAATSSLAGLVQSLGAAVETVAKAQKAQRELDPTGPR